MGAFALVVALLAEPPAPPGLPAADALVRDLASPRFRVREAAAKRLADGGRPYRPALQKATGAADAEVAERARAILAAVADREVDDLRPFPEIDAAWRDVGRHVYDYGRAPPDMARCLREVGGTPRPYEGFYRATEMWVRERLAAGTPPRLLRLVLADMHRRDADFLTRMGEPEWGPFPVDPDSYLRGFAK